MNYKNWMKLKRNLSSKTIELYEMISNRFLAYPITEEGFFDFTKNNSRNTGRTYLFALMCFLDYKVERNELKNNFLRGFKTPSQINSPRKYITQKEIEIINEDYYEDNSKIQNRTKQSIDLLFYLGLRASELLNLKRQDIKDGYVYVLGKGNKLRSIPIPTYLLQKYGINLELIELQNITSVGYSCLRASINKACSDVKISEYSPHAFRHGYASMLLNKGVDLYAISEILGHASLDTTAIYLHLSPQNLKMKITSII